MSRTAKRSPFKTSNEIDECEKMLTSWLAPSSPNTKVIDDKAPSFKQLAEELSAHFKIDPPLSAEAVRKYVNALKNGNDDLRTRERGRPHNAKQQHESALAKKQPVRKKSNELTLLAQLAAEAIQLTGLSPSALHEAFSYEKSPWKEFLGIRSGFFYRLQKKLNAQKPVSDTSSLRPDDDIEHSLRLYQITLHTADQRWCAFLFGYEPRTYFLNAACYVAHQKTDDKNRPGRPVKLLATAEHAKLTTTNGFTTLQLPPEILLDFADKTCTLMGVPVDNIYLSSSLGSQEKLISQLYALDPLVLFSTIPVRHQPFLAPNAWETLPVKSLCRKLEKLLNQHYERMALPELIKYQSHLDGVIEEFFHIKRHTSGHHAYRRRKAKSVAMDEATKSRLQQAKDWVAFRTAQNEQLHVKHHLRVAPINLACDDYRVDRLA